MHPDVRKNLLAAKAFSEGARALAVMVGLGIDRIAHHPDAPVRRDAEDFVALVTPVVKAYFTDGGVETAVNMQQMFGGHGYIRDMGMEQFVRDARISMLYEGANGVQALDLVGRKLPQNGGRAIQQFFATMQADLEQAKADPSLAEITAPLDDAFGKLQQATFWLAQNGFANPDEVGGAATDYLRIFGLVCLGWMWLKMRRWRSKSLALARMEWSRSTTPRSRHRVSSRRKCCPRSIAASRASPLARSHDGAGGGAVLASAVPLDCQECVVLAGLDPAIHLHKAFARILRVRKQSSL